MPSARGREREGTRLQVMVAAKIELDELMFTPFEQVGMEIARRIRSTCPVECRKPPERVAYGSLSSPTPRQHTSSISSLSPLSELAEVSLRTAHALPAPPV